MQITCDNALQEAVAELLTLKTKLTKMIAHLEQAEAAAAAQAEV